jgi:DHA1 family inner membrane transport protein
VVIGAPLLAVLGARWPRRNLLIALMSVFALGNFASALAPGYLPMLAVRLLTGFPHGTYFGVAALVAASLVARERRAQAVGLVMLGLTVATLVGVPIAAGIGTWLGWRAAFVIVGAIGALTALLVWRWVPFVPADRHASPLRELSALVPSALVACSRCSAMSSRRCSRWRICPPAVFPSCWRCSASAWWPAIWPARSWRTRH